MEGQEIGMHEKIATNRNIFSIWGRPLGVTATSYIFRKLFFWDNISVEDSMPLSSTLDHK